MIKRLCAVAALAVVLLGVSGVLGVPQAGTGAALPGSLFVPDSIERPLHQADIFRQCLQVSNCGLDRNGYRRCGLVWRCQKCQFVRACTRASGCTWQEKCTWGPYTPPIQQPLRSPRPS